jgi:hypothetical protein
VGTSEPNAEGPAPTEVEEEQATTERRREEDELRYPNHGEDANLGPDGGGDGE